MAKLVVEVPDDLLFQMKKLRIKPQNSVLSLLQSLVRRSLLDAQHQQGLAQDHDGEERRHLEQSDDLASRGR